MDQVTLRDFVSDIGTEADRLTRITEHLLALTGWTACRRQRPSRWTCRRSPGGRCPCWRRWRTRLGWPWDPI